MNSHLWYEPHALQQKAYDDILGRLEKLSPQSQAQWGKMNVAQMLAHVTANLEMATSDKKVRQAFMGRIFGKGAKQQILTSGAQPRNMGTFSYLKIVDQREFEKEKEVLRLKLARFYQGGEAAITRQPHGFFGCLTPNEWARLQYIHIDHHFKQFGV
jgi:Protein of unknown function (DUF1569)